MIGSGSIEPKRLDAVPWTPYGLKHQNLFEAASRPKPTLLTALDHAVAMNRMLRHA